MHEDSSEHGKQFFIPIVLTIVTIVLGLISFHAVFPDYPFFRKLYYTFQLFTLESGDRFYEAGGQPLIVRITFNLARFFAVTTLVVTIVLAILSVLRYKYFLSRVRYMKNHTILCGLGEVGEAIAENFTDKKKLVIIEKDASNENLPGLKKEGAKIIKANALDTTVLDNIGVEHARSVVALTGNDFDNFTIVNHILEIIKNKGTDGKNVSLCANIDSRNLKTAITVEWLNKTDSTHCVLTQRLLTFRYAANELVKNKINGSLTPEIEQRYEGAKRTLLEYDPVSDTCTTTLENVKLFNINQLAGRYIFLNYPPDRFRKITKPSDKVMQILFLGFSSIGEELLKRCFQNCHYINRKEIKITVIARDNEISIETIKSKYKNINRLIDLHIINQNPHHITNRFINDNDLKNTDAIYICSGEDRLQASYSSKARELFGGAVPVVRYFYGNNLLCKYDKINNIYSFNIFSKIGNHEIIISEAFDRKAILVHNRWIEQSIKDYINFKAEPNILNNLEVPPPKPTLVPWHLASEEIREDNRSAVDHINVKLRTVDQLNDPVFYNHPEEANIDYGFLLSNSIVDSLAEMEHRRWMANKFICGWVTKEPRNDLEKEHDCLLDFGTLKKDIQDYDRQQIRDIRKIVELK